MLDRLRAALPEVEAHEGTAEAIPLPDDSADAVTVAQAFHWFDGPKALAEIARVLRPGGQLLFIEHVRAESPALARWQDRLLGPWRRFACGCRCNRATVELMRACGFEVKASHGTWRAMPPIVRPLMSGRAQPSGLGHD
jgi:SAM-dependent methyltransferase